MNTTSNTTTRVATALTAIATTLVIFQSVALLAQPTPAPVQMAAAAHSTTLR